MRVLVTGARGFIGQEFCRVLADAGFEVCGLDRKMGEVPSSSPRVSWKQCDLLDLENLKKVAQEFSPEAIVNLGAKTGLKNYPAGSEYFAANTRGTEHLIQVAQEVVSIRRMVYVSTKYVWRGEGMPGHREYAPATTYGESKVLSEEMVWEANGGCQEWCIVRPTTIWGPGMSTHYQRFLSMLRKGFYFHIGTKPVRKDMGYVGNTAYQLMRLLQVDAKEMHEKIFYLADYETVILEEWAEGFRKEFKSGPVWRVPRVMARAMAYGGDILNATLRRRFPFTSFRYRNLTDDDCCDVSLTQEVCGELPYSRAEAIKLTANWYQEGDR